MARQRASIHVFGLSMLDTITCGLGGSMVLFVILATMAKPLAAVSYTQQGDAGPVEVSAEAGKTAPDGSKSDPFLVGAFYLTFLEEVSTAGWSDLKTAQCSSLPSESLSGLEVKAQTSVGFEVGELGASTLGGLIWLKRNNENSGPGCIEVKLPDLPGGRRPCTLTYLGDAHDIDLTYGICPQTLYFERKNNLYTLARLP